MKNNLIRTMLGAALAVALLGVAPAATAQTSAYPISFVGIRTITTGQGNKAVKTTYYDLTVMNADGSNPTVIASSTTQFRASAWSPDLDADPANGYQGTLAVEGVRPSIYIVDLYLIDVTVNGGLPQGSNLRRLINADIGPTAGLAVDAAWSPDLDAATAGYQGYIAFIGSNDGGNSCSLNVIQMASSGLTADPVNGPDSEQVFYDGHDTSNFLFYPTWSPDGSQIAISSDVGGVYRLDVIQTSGEPNLTTILSNGSNYYGDLEWSKTDSRIAFILSGKLNTVDVETKAITAVAGATQHNRSPSWSVDGRSLVYSGKDKSSKGTNQTYKIRKVDLSNGAQTILAAASGDLTYPNWAP
jgi:Tol biopolymer transport system component